MESILNYRGVEVKVGDYWTIESPPNNYRTSDQSWIMRIDRIQEKNKLASFSYVNWKRNGKGTNYWSINDIGSFASMRKATREEEIYFETRI